MRRGGRCRRRGLKAPRKLDSLFLQGVDRLQFSDLVAVRELSICELSLQELLRIANHSHADVALAVALNGILGHRIFLVVERIELLLQGRRGRGGCLRGNRRVQHRLRDALLQSVGPLAEHRENKVTVGQPDNPHLRDEILEVVRLGPELLHLLVLSRETGPLQLGRDICVGEPGLLEDVRVGEVDRGFRDVVPLIDLVQALAGC